MPTEDTPHLTSAETIEITNHLRFLCSTVTQMARLDLQLRLERLDSGISQKLRAHTQTGIGPKSNPRLVARFCRESGLYRFTGAERPQPAIPWGLSLR